MKTRRLLVPAAGSLLLLLPLAGTASAHVTVQGPEAKQGGFSKLTFRVPTEKEVPTTKIEIAFPTDAPLAFVSTKPKAGWTAQVVKGAPAEPFEAYGEQVTEVVQRITWTVAAGGKGIAAGEFDEFEVSAGPLPESEQMVFKALQTYADGEVVRWIDEPVEGGEDPEKPAPVLELAAAEEGGGHGGGSDDAKDGAADPVADVDTTPVASSSGDGGNGLSVAALVASGLALLVSGFSLVRGRRSA